MRNWSIGGSGFAFWKFVNRDVNTAGLSAGLIGGLPAVVATCCLQHVAGPWGVLKGSACSSTLNSEGISTGQ